LLPGCTGGGTANPTAKSPGPARTEDQLESARQVLSGSPDRAGCATALQLINGYVAAHPEQRPPALTAEQKKLLATRFGLDPAELAEVESPTYTLLDGPHLGLCFLMRDVARSLDVDKLSPAEQAAAAFAWTMRQVAPLEGEGDLPPEFVLRRGLGSGPERAYVFLALLQQMGIPGCLLTTPGGSPPWACGALVEVEGLKEKQVLVFDHRLGLPLPGEKGPAASALARAFRLGTPMVGPDDGQQIVTLAALRAKPDLLKPMTVDAKYPYEVGPEQVKETLVRLAPPLSALSPRVRLLEDKFLPPRAGVRPAVDPAELIAQFGAAAGVEGGADAVRAREGAAGVLRRFLGQDEGGTDREGRQLRARLALFPPNALPRQLAELEGDPGKRIVAFSAQQFIAFQMEPNQPRDLVLRGQFKEAVGQLSGLRDLLRIQKDKLASNPEVREEFDRWKDKLYKAFGEESRARDELRTGGSQEAVEEAAAARERVWKSGIGVLSVLVEGGTAEPRSAQATYQLALDMHEQAERLHALAEQLAHGNPPAEADELKKAREEAREAWKEAAGWWNTFIQYHPLTPFSNHARLLHAGAQEALRNPERARALLLEDTAHPVSGPDKVARLYMAQRLKPSTK
jgi:hypothetical protein